MGLRLGCMDDLVTGLPQHSGVLEGWSACPWPPAHHTQQAHGWGLRDKGGDPVLDPVPPLLFPWAPVWLSPRGWQPGHMVLPEG